jgi:hypothetical protein
MPVLLPPLHEGHAPFILHQAFDDALDAYEEWAPGSSEPFVDFDGASVAISAVFGRMRSCTDILPVRILDAVRAVIGAAAVAEIDEDQATYARAALLLRALCVDRLKT